MPRPGITGFVGEGGTLVGLYVYGPRDCGTYKLDLIRHDSFVFYFTPTVQSTGDSCMAARGLLNGQQLMMWVSETGELALQWEPGMLWEKEHRRFRRLTAEEEQAERTQKEREARWQEARTPTRTIGTYHVEHFTDGERTWLGKENNTHSYDVDITDEGVRVAKEVRSKLTGRSGDESAFAWWQVIALKDDTGAAEVDRGNGAPPAVGTLSLDKYMVSVEGDDNASLVKFFQALEQAWAEWKARFPEFVHVAEAVQTGGVAR